MEAIQYRIYHQPEVRVFVNSAYFPLVWDFTGGILKIWNHSELRLVAADVQEVRLIDNYEPPATDTEGNN